MERLGDKVKIRNKGPIIVTHDQRILGLYDRVLYGGWASSLQKQIKFLLSDP